MPVLISGNRVIGSTEKLGRLFVVITSSPPFKNGPTKAPGIVKEYTTIVAH